MMEFVRQGLAYCKDNKRYFIQPIKDVGEGIKANLDAESKAARENVTQTASISANC